MPLLGKRPLYSFVLLSGLSVLLYTFYISMMPYWWMPIAEYVPFYLLLAWEIRRERRAGRAWRCADADTNRLVGETGAELTYARDDLQHSGRVGDGRAAVYGADRRSRSGTGRRTSSACRKSISACRRAGSWTSRRRAGKGTGHAGRLSSQPAARASAVTAWPSPRATPCARSRTTCCRVSASSAGRLQVTLDTPHGLLTVFCTHWGLNGAERERQAARAGGSGDGRVRPGHCLRRLQRAGRTPPVSAFCWTERACAMPTPRRTARPTPPTRPKRGLITSSSRRS